MKALIYTGVEALDYRETDRPEPKEGEALVKIIASGICGSDMHAFRGHDNRRPAPLILGHEAAGVVQGGPMDGRRVTINPLVTCMSCGPCLDGRTNLCAERQIISMPPRPGAFAEWVAIPMGNLVEIPDGTTFEQAALAEPIACGWHAVRLGQNVLGKRLASARALVIGGGAIGLGAALSLSAQGVNDITLIEPNNLRRDFLKTRCAINAIEPAEAQSSAYDIVIDGVGFVATRAQASAAVMPGGVILHIGLGSDEGGLDVRRMTLQEITFIGTYTYTAEDFRATAQAIFDGRLGALDWTEQRPLSEGANAFADIRAGATIPPKTLLIPAHEE